MKKTFATVFIASYLGILAFGVACHAVTTGVGMHPAMYYIVWDMFCGWDAYANKVHILAEGDSGKYYELTPAPWGEFRPYGICGRQHYDARMYHSYRFASNTLRHTSHEPIQRIHVFEELWSKKFNVPEHLWSKKFEVPYDKMTYIHPRLLLDPDGKELERLTTWHENRVSQLYFSDPRLMAEMRGHRPLLVAPARAQTAGGISGGASPPFTMIPPVGN